MMPAACQTVIASLICSIVLAGCSANTVQVRQLPAAPAVSKGTRVAPAEIAPSATSTITKAPQTLPVPVVVLSGSPTEIGTAHGQQLAGNIRMLQEKYLHVFIANDTQLATGRLAAGIFGSLMLPEHRQETMGVAVGSGVGSQDLMLTQCFLDLTPINACSTVALPASASSDGVARLGRTLDFPSLGVADKVTTLFIVKPTGRYAFASVGWPGMIGVMSGMNEHGLTLSNMEVDRGVRMPTAMPYTLLYRAILEQCRTVDEAIAFLQKTGRQTPNNLMLMDATGDRAVAEITPESVVVRRAEVGAALISTNHQRGSDATTPGECPRYDYLRKQTTRDFGGIDRTAVESMLQHVGNTMTLQAMIFEPTTRALYLAAGSHAADRQFSRVDLAALFK